MQYMGEKCVACYCLSIRRTHVHILIYSGYLESCRSIVGAAKRIEATIKNEIPELSIMGNPLASVIAFTSNDAAVNIHAVGDAMSSRGWHLNALTNPPGLHIACTVRILSLTAAGGVHVVPRSAGFYPSIWLFRLLRFIFY